MKNKDYWWQWPKNYRTGTVAWYTIFARALCYPFIYFGLSITFLAFLGGWGWSQAVNFWQENA